jgi:type I restriction enzyme, S subunit
MSESLPASTTKYFRYIPEDWQLAPLRNLVSKKITYGIVQPGNFDPQGIPLIRGVDYMSGWKDQNSFFKVSKELHKQFERSVTKAGDVLLSIAGYAGSVTVVPDFINEANITQTTARISVSDQLINNKFLSEFLGSVEGRQQSKRYTKGSAQEGLNLQDVEKFVIPLPPLPEQKKIAFILTSVDEVIENTQKQIDKLQDLKKATMNELLTKGIGHTEFKDSELGRIPKSWEVERLGEVAIKIGDGIHSTPKYSTEGSFAFINGNNLANGKIIFSNSTKKVDFDEYQKHKTALSIPTILLSINGTIGNLAFYNNEKVVLGKSAAFISLNQNICPEYIFFLLGSRMIQKHFEDELTGTTIRNLSLKSIRNTPIPLPSLEEQINIKSVLLSVSKSIEAKEAKLAQTQALKKSLMQDLLTGKKRVQVN